MNTFTAVIFFAAICTLPACFAVPVPNSCGTIYGNKGLVLSSLQLAPSWGWGPSCWSPYTNLALSNGALAYGSAYLPELAVPAASALSAPVLSSTASITSAGELSQTVVQASAPQLVKIPCPVSSKILSKY